MADGTGAGAKAARWTGVQRERFLRALAETADIAGAAKAAGGDAVAAHAERRASAAFRARWADALDDAMTTLAAAMVRRGLATFGAGRTKPKEPMSERGALAIIAQHRQDQRAAKAQASETIAAKRRRETRERGELERVMTAMRERLAAGVVDAKG